MCHVTKLTRFALVVALIAVLAAQRPASAVLVNHWDLDEADGLGAPQILDSVGGNNGTFVNMDDSNRSTDTPSLLSSGRSLSFAASGAERVSIASQIALADTDNYSVSLWYRGTDTTANGDWGHVLLGRRDGDIYANLILRNGFVEFLHAIPAWQHNIKSTTLVADGQWHHIAYVNHSNETGDLYIDGILEVAAASSSISENTNPFRIDHFMWGYNDVYTDGLLDEIHVYDHSLMQQEVTLLFEGAFVPEPSTFALLGPGLGSLAMLRRRRSRK